MRARALRLHALIRLGETGRAEQDIADRQRRAAGVGGAAARAAAATARAVARAGPRLAPGAKSPASCRCL